MERRLGFFERYLSLWVALCMVAGVALGKLLPSLVQVLRGLEFGQGSQINVPNRPDLLRELAAGSVAAAEILKG